MSKPARFIRGRRLPLRCRGHGAPLRGFQRGSRRLGDLLRAVRRWAAGM